MNKYESLFACESMACRHLHAFITWIATRDNGTQREKRKILVFVHIISAIFSFSKLYLRTYVYLYLYFFLTMKVDERIAIDPDKEVFSKIKLQLLTNWILVLVFNFAEIKSVHRMQT